MFNYDIMIKDINNEWLSFFDNNKDELYYIIHELNSYTNIIYPNPCDVFKSLKYFSPNKIKLVILGQDPYINNENNIAQATGLSFSVPHCHKKIPQSLMNIFKEIQNCYPNYQIPTNGCIERWALEENILLLNATLTVESGKSNSHKHIWSKYIDNLIKFIDKSNENIIFLLMGNFAINKSKLIDISKHKIFTTAHPSPLSSHKFFNCKVFKLINNYLEDNEKEIINW